MSKYQLYCSCIKCKLPTTTQNLNRHFNTHCIQLPSCLFCNKETKNKKFCSSSCAASYNNMHRSEETLSKLKNLRNVKRKENPVKVKTPRKIRTRCCIKCGQIDETTGRFQSDKCMFCNDSLTYRESCKFTFDIRKYPDEFDLSLLSKYGMFNPKTNQTGVSKDHMLSINYGKLHKINPCIMSHPANCKLLLQSENKAKQHFSSITEEELILRIKLWNQKYNDAGTGNAPISVQAYETCRVT